jgi:outer membrane protein TolC
MNGVRGSNGTGSGMMSRVGRTNASGQHGLVWIRSTVIGSWLMTAALGLVAGCGFSRPDDSVDQNADANYYQLSSTAIEYPDVVTPINDDALATAAPLTVTDESDIEFRYVALQEAVHTALMNSRVLRDLGGAVLRSPGDVNTTFDVALQELDPRFGVAAALSEFDASFATSAFHDKNDRALNNQFFGGGTRKLKQDTATIESQLTKRAATGTELTFLKHTEYDQNNAPGNFFGSAWTTWLDMEARHPLLQGGGTEFNRIAGPSDSPATVNGVVIARLRTDTSLADFEMSVRDFVSNVENAYWDLYFAYRDLDARIVARDNALATWNRINALYESGRVGGEAEKEAQAREQYFRFQEQVQNALSGRLDGGTRTNNGTAGGSFRGNGGVLSSERRLRLLMGMTINDGQLLRPQDEPIVAQVTFDWDSILVEALSRRGELRRQKWVIKQREQELIASRNFLLPSLDLVGRYRWRGLGRDLLKQHDPGIGAPATAGDLDAVAFNNAWENLLGGNFQEWQLGFEFSMPIGNRRAHAAVEYAELLLSRERTILSEQEREVVLALSEVIAELSRTWSILETSEDRRIAASEQLAAVQAAFDADKVNFDVLLDAQRRFLDAETNYHRVMVEYTIAVRNVHFEKGSLLDYNEVFLTEDLWPMKAYSDGMRRQEHQIPAEWLHGIVTHPQALSAGPYNQNMMPGDAPEWEGGAYEGEAVQAEPLETEAPPLETEPANDSASLLNGLNDSQSTGNLAVPRDGLLPETAEAGVSLLPLQELIEIPQAAETRNGRESVPRISEFDTSSGLLGQFKTIEFESPATTAVEADAEYIEVAPLPPAEPLEFLPPKPVAE